MSLDTLLSGLRQRREEAATSARTAYYALVRRLAGGGPAKDDSPAAVACVLEAAGLDETRLVADVARVERFRRLLARARRLPEAQAAHEEATGAAIAAREQLEAETRRLRAAVAEASSRHAMTQRQLEGAQEALEEVLPGAPARLRARFEEARRDLDTILGAIAIARANDAAHRAHAPAVLRHVEAERAALREAVRAVDEHDKGDNFLAGMRNEQNEHLAQRRELEAKVEEAREAFRLALLRAADEAETQDVPRARAELVAATAALFDAEFVLDPELEDEDSDDDDEGGEDA